MDATDLEAGKRLAKVALEAGADWVEAGTPLIVFAGVRAIGALAALCGDTAVVADYKCQDGVEKYFREAGRQGARVATVLGFVPNGSIKAAVRGGRAAGVEVMADMYGLREARLGPRARELESLGVDYLLLHLGHDEAQDEPHRTVLDGLEELAAAVRIPVGVATFTEQEAVAAVRRGASFIVQGHPILNGPGALRKLRDFIGAVKGTKP